MQRIAIALVAVVLAACGSDAGAEDATSGIRGHASAGPQCPVEVQGSPCPDLPWQGTVIATDAESGEESTVTTDAEGRFEFSLDPGTYEVTIAPGSSPPSAETQTVVVEADSFTEIVIAVDTGIR